MPPWLNLVAYVQLQRGISDEAYETIPVQLLARLRADSVGSISETNEELKVHFTGFDDYPYTVESSSNLVNWIPLSTNYPTNGFFEFIEPVIPGRGYQFYRSKLQ